MLLQWSGIFALSILKWHLSGYPLRKKKIWHPCFWLMFRSFLITCIGTAGSQNAAAESWVNPIVPEFFNLTFPMLFEMFNSAAPSKSGKSTLASDAEQDTVEEISVPSDKILDCLKSCIHIAHINHVLEQQDDLMHVLITSLSDEFPWTVKISGFSAMKELCSRLCEVLDETMETSIQPKIASLVQKMCEMLSPKVVECLNTVKIAQVHITASDCLLEMFKLYVDLLSTYRTANVELKNELLHVHEAEKNGEAKSLLKRCIDILDGLTPHPVQET